MEQFFITKECLRRLRAKAEEIVTKLCDPLERVKIDIICSNWADLHCVGAYLVIRDDGTQFYRVDINEADPLSGELREYIRTKLADAGYGNVEVLTEW